jgi:hypothetical protein
MAAKVYLVQCFIQVDDIAGNVQFLTFVPTVVAADVAMYA